MKYIIVGRHSSNQHYILQILKTLGISVGFESSTVRDPKGYYLDPNYEYIDVRTANNIFELNEYIYMSSFGDGNYKLLPFHTFDSVDVMTMGPEEVNQINIRMVRDEVTFIWVDDTTTVRRRNYIEESRNYDWRNQEEIESVGNADFMDNIYKLGHVLYFTNEDPHRVATTIYTLIKYPNLLDLYKETYK